MTDISTIGDFNMHPHIPALTGAGCAFRTKPAENKLAITNDSFTKRTRGRPGHVIPLHVLNIAAAVADEVMVPHACGVESASTAFDGHLSHQAGLYQVPQIVISRSPGRARIHAIHGFKDLRSRGMPLVIYQERHYRVTLRRTAQTIVFQGLLYRIGRHQRI
jgi:hypothetical protein